ncbi:MAG: hypothetical protein QXT99_10170 [Candidatus Nitrosotenuis sp.]
MIIDLHHDRAFVEGFYFITFQYQGKTWVFEACHNVRKNSNSDGNLLIYWPENIYSKWYKFLHLIGAMFCTFSVKFIDEAVICP